MNAARASAEGARLIEAGRVLRGLSVAVRAHGLARAASIWARADAPPRRRLAPELEAVTGFSRPVIEAGLDRLFGAVREEALLSWWARHAGPDARSPVTTGAGVGPEPPRLAAVVAAGNIPGVALFPAVACLLAGVPALVKTSSAEPLLLPAWLETLTETTPDLGRASGTLAWRGGDAAVETAALERAERILVFGSDATVSQVRARWPGRTAGYGTGVSLALVGEEAGDEAAHAMALDVALWDQQGCLSPQGAFVVGDTARAMAFAGRLAEALAGIQRELPRGRLTTAEAARIREFRADAEARAVGGGDVRLWTSGGGLEWTVVAEPTPGFDVSCLNRTVWVRPLPALEDLPLRLAPWARWLQGAGIAVGPAERPQARAALRLAGVPHVVPLGTLQAPAVDWPNKGRDLLGDLLGVRR